MGALAPRGITGCSEGRRVRLRLLRDTSAASKQRSAVDMTRAMEKLSNQDPVVTGDGQMV